MLGLGVLPALTLLWMFASELAIAFSDVVVDSIVVNYSRDSESPEAAGGLQSLCWGCQAIGSLTSSLGGGYMIQWIGPQASLLVMALFPLFISACSLLIDERRMERLTAAHFAEDPKGGDHEELLEGAPLTRPHPREYQGGISVFGVQPWGDSGVYAVEQLWALGRALIMPAILFPTIFIFVAAVRFWV